jgi:hypothetical protein
MGRPFGAIAGKLPVAVEALTVPTSVLGGFLPSDEAVPTVMGDELEAKGRGVVCAYTPEATTHVNSTSRTAWKSRSIFIGIFGLRKRLHFASLMRSSVTRTKPEDISKLLAAHATEHIERIGFCSCETLAG